MVDDEIACQILRQNDELMAKIRRRILWRNWPSSAKSWIIKDVLEWVRPSGGVICFPHIKDEIELDTDEFYDVLNNKYGVFVGPGHWFQHG